MPNPLQGVQHWWIPGISNLPSVIYRCTYQATRFCTLCICLIPKFWYPWKGTFLSQSWRNCWQDYTKKFLRWMIPVVISPKCKKASRMLIFFLLFPWFYSAKIFPLIPLLLGKNISPHFEENISETEALLSLIESRQMRQLFRAMGKQRRKRCLFLSPSSCGTGKNLQNDTGQMMWLNE